MQTEKRPSHGGSGRDGRGDRRESDVPAAPDRPRRPARPARSRDPYEDERDQAIDADPQLREIGRARLRKRTDRHGPDGEPGAPRR